MLCFAWKRKIPYVDTAHNMSTFISTLTHFGLLLPGVIYIIFFNLSIFFQDAAVHFNASAKYYHLFGKLILLTVSCAHQTHLALLSGMIKPFSTTAAVLHKEQLVCVRFSHLIRTAAPSFRVIKPFPPPS